MNKWRKDLQKNRIIKRLSSINVTVACLVLLFILTFWGTIAQVDQGLYGAQERFFFSWFFLAGGILPFPGAKLVLWIFFLNLLSVSLIRFVYDKRHIGITLIHLGLLSYFVSAFVTFYVTVESHVTLREGTGTNLSVSYREWELSLWEGDASQRDVTAVDASAFREGAQFDLGDLSVAVKKYYPNAQAYTTSGHQTASALNPSGIKSLARIPLDIEPEKNIPGGIFLIRSEDRSQEVLLYGGEGRPYQWEHRGRNLNAQLRRKNMTLPFVIKLKDFEKEDHPGTDVAKSYKSLVTIVHDGIERDVLIWMNHPLRFKDYTLYQASYSYDQMGREYSTLAVVKNAGRLLPYFASGLTFVGLAVHFMSMGFRPRRKDV